MNIKHNHQKKSLAIIEKLDTKKKDVDSERLEIE
jgi:hypothetical protein